MLERWGFLFSRYCTVTVSVVDAVTLDPVPVTVKVYDPAATLDDAEVVPFGAVPLLIPQPPAKPTVSARARMAIVVQAFERATCRTLRNPKSSTPARAATPSGTDRPIGDPRWTETVFMPPVCAELWTPDPLY